MIDRIIVYNLADLNSLTGKVYDSNIDFTFEKGQINKVDPRIPQILEYLNNSLRVTSWKSVTNVFPMRVAGRLKFKNQKEFITLIIEFAEKYKYTAMFDGGYLTEDESGGIFSETIETLSGQVLLEFNYLDLPWGIDGKDPELPKQPLTNFGMKAFEYQNVLEELKYSFSIVNWRSGTIEGTSLRTIREYLQSLYNISGEYIKGVWEKWMPKLDLGVDQVDGDTILIKTKASCLPIDLSSQGTGAIMLFKSLPVFLLEDRTIVISNNCSYFSELHPVLKKHLINNVLFGDKGTKRTMVIQEDTDIG